MKRKIRCQLALPVIIYITSGEKVEVTKRSDLTYVSSAFYQSNKVRVYNNYKPGFLNEND